MKQLSSFMVVSAGGVDRVSYAYDEFEENGDIKSTNNRGNFAAVDASLKKHIEAIKKYISDSRLAE